MVTFDLPAIGPRMAFDLPAIASRIALVVAVACTGTPATQEAPPPAEAPATAPANPPTPPAGAANAPPPDAPPAAAAAPAPGAPPANAADFEPISVPLGPREGGGVRWDGVHTKSAKPIDYGGGEVYDPKLETQRGD